ncbi:MAG: hypothetical protein K0S44_2578, partial [Bacteroidetes bacterium]|nr:hypothetical protein [Bacteroidota bacterium]
THFINLTGLMIIYEGANVLPKRGDVNKNRIYFRSDTESAFSMDSNSSRDKASDNL